MGTAQQIAEAFSGDTALRYLLHDREETVGPHAKGRARTPDLWHYLPALEQSDDSFGGEGYAAIALSRSCDFM